MLVLKIFPRLSKSAAFSRPKLRGTPTSPPRKPPMPHNDGSATDRASAWRARKNRRRLHTACSEPARANCSVCLRLHWVGAFFLSLFATAQQWLPSRVSPGARAALLWHPLLRRMVEYQHQVIVDLQTGVDCTQCAVSPPGRTAACATLCLWRVGTFSKKGLVLTATGTHSGHCTRGWGLAHRCRLHARG
jgi:hypothetical protein